METVTFLTSNRQKFQWASDRLRPYDIRLEQEERQLPETQAIKTEQVARKKAEYATRFIQQPFFVADTGFEIQALDGFPGALLKPVMHTIGAEGLCKLMEDEDDRSCTFKNVLAYVDQDGDIHTFTCNDTGTVAREPAGGQRDQWGDIMRLHQPDGFDTTLAAMSDDEFSDYEDRMASEEHYVKFAEWFTDQA